MKGFNLHWYLLWCVISNQSGQCECLCSCMILLLPHWDVCPARQHCCNLMHHIGAVEHCSSLSVEPLFTGPYLGVHDQGLFLGLSHLSPPYKRVTFHHEPMPKTNGTRASSSVVWVCQARKLGRQQCIAAVLLQHPTLCNLTTTLLEHSKLSLICTECCCFESLEPLSLLPHPLSAPQ